MSKVRYFLLFLVLASCSHIEAVITSTDLNLNSPLVEDVLNAGLPVIHVVTVNSEEPTCEYVWHPEGYAGASITNATKVPGRLIFRK